MQINLYRVSKITLSFGKLGQKITWTKMSNKKVGTQLGYTYMFENWTELIEFKKENKGKNSKVIFYHAILYTYIPYILYTHYIVYLYVYISILYSDIYYIVYINYVLQCTFEIMRKDLTSIIK